MATGAPTLPLVAKLPWCRLLACALAVHVAWGLVRVPKVVGRRIAHVRAHQQHGAVEALFRANDLEGAGAIAWLLANTPPHSVIAWTGTETGAMEFAPALAWPRLFVAASRLGPGGDHAGRPIASGELDGRRGRIVLVATPRELRLEVR
jgi:hypothetical protein